MLTGFVRKAVIPHCFALFTSSLNALAVIAIIGTVFAYSLRIFLISFAQDVNKAKKCGMTAFLTKPVNSDELSRTLTQAVSEENV